MNDEMKSPFDTKEWKDLSEKFNDGVKQMQARQEEYWNTLTADQQLDVFCVIMSKLAKGELDEGRTYRGILYDTFGWGPDAYMPAQVSGFLDIHNAIFSYEEKVDMIKKFCQQAMDITKDDLDEQIRNYILKRDYL